MESDFTGPDSPDSLTALVDISSNSVQDTDYEFHVVCFRDIKQLAGDRHPVYKLLPIDFLMTARQFPGAVDDFPIFFYLSYKGMICAYMRLIPDQITVDGQTRQWAWTGDNYTDPQFRRRGLSTRLQQTATQHLHNLGIGRGSVYSTEITQRIFNKLGFTNVGYAKRFLLLRDITPFLEARITKQPLRGIAIRVLNPLVRFAVGCARRRNKKAIDRTICQQVTDFSDPQFQHLLESVIKRRSLHFGMQSDLLQRKFEVAKKTGTMSAWLILEKKTGASLAYMILRERFQDKPLSGKYRGFHLMSLVDCAMVSEDAKTAVALVANCLEIFFHSDCSVLEIVSNIKNVHDAALRRGLLPVGKGMSFNYSVPSDWQWSADRSQLEKWPLTGFCGDGFTF